VLFPKSHHSRSNFSERPLVSDAHPNPAIKTLTDLKGKLIYVSAFANFFKGLGGDQQVPKITANHFSNKLLEKHSRSLSDHTVNSQQSTVKLFLRKFSTVIRKQSKST
jgi:hypothetical protein